MRGRSFPNVWGKTNSCEQGICVLNHFFTGEFAVQDKRLNENLEHAPSGVQGASGILKYELDLRAKLTARAFPKLDDVFSFKPNVSCRRRLQTGETGRQRTLA